MVEPHLPAETSRRRLGLRRRCPCLAERERPPTRGDHVRSAGTDGAGVVAVARLAGCGPDGGAVLRMRGGGGAARSVAHAWVNAGGRVHLIEGRRPLAPALPDTASAGFAEQAALGIDFDGEGKGLDASKHLIPAYQNKAVHAEGSLDGPSSTGVGCWSPSTSKHGASSGHQNSKPCCRPSLI